MKEKIIIEALEKTFKEGFELIQYETGTFGMENYCDHKKTITSIEELIEWANKP